MNNRFSYFVALTAVLTGAAATGHAFTLGELRGSAVIGRALDVTVPVQAGVGEEASAACLSTEVLFGDLVQSGASVSVSTVTGGPVPMSLVRIKSSAVVDEPVVTVVLRSSCGSTNARHYVLLADFPAPDLPKNDGASAVGLPQASGSALPARSSQPNAAAALPAAPLAAVPKPATRVASGQIAKPAAPKTVVLLKKPSPKPAVAKPAASPEPVVVKPAASPEPVVAKPVLKLDPQVVLPSKGDVPVPAALPASAAASAPDDLAVQQAQRIESLQNDVKALKELALKNQVTVAEFQTKLQQADSDRVPMTWFYLVSGALLASLAALTWALRRQQNTRKADEAWWQQAKAESIETVAMMPASAVQNAAPLAAAETPRQVDLPLGAAETEPGGDVDIDLDSLAPVDEPASAAVPLAVAPVDGFAVVHDINLESISDIRQQAEFFVSLGQTDRALNILRKQILESPDPNPLVYLDLLSLYHAQGMKGDFRELRAAFGRFFNGVLPDFPAFHMEGKDLQAYPGPLAVLVRFWPKIEAIAFLEACIFRNDSAPMQLTFELAAFRELLLLHAIAEKVTSDAPWKMTAHAGLEANNTVQAEMAGLAMAMELHGKAEADADAAKAEAKTQEIAKTAVLTAAEVDAEEADTGYGQAGLANLVSSPPAQGVDLDLALPDDGGLAKAQNPTTVSADPSVKSPFRDSFF